MYDPLSILGKLFPYLGGSASVVVYSPHLQVRVPRILSGVG
jgi:tRNA (adenine-N(1)-)-methyltransferase non-catalytic subunit